MITGIAAILIISVYFCGLLCLAIAWVSYDTKRSTTNINLPVSIIIPCRNEEKTILTCVESIYRQNYPAELIEVIVVDDDSEDATVDLVEKDGRCKLIRIPLHLKGKKAALTEGIGQATHELIITRDADTFSETDWLKTIVHEQVSTGADMLICPVTLSEEKGFLNVFQRLEYYAFTIITGATTFIKRPVLCNGANLCFKKKTFDTVKGYEGNTTIASGDDVFLLNKIASLPEGKIRYVKKYEATVFTSAEHSFMKMIHQRLRWAGKNTRNTNLWNAFTGISIFLANISWLFMAVLSVFYKESAGYFAIITAIKCIIDFLLLFLGSTFHKQRKALIAFPLMVIFYPAYIAIIAIASLVIKPDWKGRSIN